MGRSSVFIILLVALFLSPIPVLADIAPPDWPPGANLAPGSENTQVRMVSEIVVIDVQENIPVGSLGEAKVRASFTMHNLGSDNETMFARFPLTYWDGYSGSSSSFPEIKDVEFVVGGEPVDWRRVDIPVDDGETVPWAEFGVTFPPGQDVLIDVLYTARPVGEYPYVAYRYVLETGAGWRGSIEEADIIVNLPYETNSHNVILDETIGWSTTTAGAIFDGNEVRWHFENLEPTRENNIEVSLVMPNAWQKVMEERSRIADNPEDGEAWGRLGKGYKEVSYLRRWYREDEGGQELYLLSVEAYEKALELLPDDALWHAGFAELLYTHSYWDVFTPGSPNLDEMQRAVEQIKIAYDLKPEDSKVLEILGSMSSGLPGINRIEEGFVFLILTATPTIVPTSTPEVTSSATSLPVTPTEPYTTTANEDVQETPIPANTNTPTASLVPVATSTPSTGSSSLPFCGSALLIIPMVGVLVRKRWRRA